MNEVKNRVVFTPEAFCSQKWGGVSNVFCNVADSLQKIDYEVTVFSGFHGNQHLSTFPEISQKGVKVGKPKNLWKLNRWFSRKWLNFSGVVTSNTVIHDTYYWDGYKKLFPKNPYVVTIHDMIGDLFPDNSGWSQKALKRREKAGQLADIIIVPSESTRRDLMKFWNIPEEKIKVIHWGVSLLKPEPWTPPAWPYALHVGGRKRYKDFETTVLALEQLISGGWEGGIICFGDELSLTERKRLKDIGFPSDRILNERGSDEKLTHIYQKAEFLIYQSTYEGFGLPILEAMINGCPVICSSTPALVEAAGKAALVAETKNPNDFAEKMKELISSETLRNELIQKGLYHAQKKTWVSAARLHIKAYDEAWRNCRES